MWSIKNDNQRRWIIYLLSCLLFTFSQFYRSSIAVISPNLIAELNLDTKDLSIISAAFFYAFGLMQIPISLYLDSVGPRILMSALSLVAAAGAAIFAFGETAAVLTTGRLLLGLGMACNLMGPLKLLTSWFSPTRFATLSAIFLSVGTAGNIAAATPLVWLTKAIGWRNTFLSVALCNLALVILFYAIASDKPEDQSADQTTRVPRVSFSAAISDLLPLFGRRDYWLISAGTFFRYGIFASVQALWAGPFLMMTMGLSQVMTGNLLFAISVGLIIGSPFCGWISDSILHSRKQVVIAGLAAMAGCLITLSLVPETTWLPVIFILFFVFGFASSSGQIMFAHIKERVPHEKAGAAMTGINFFTMIGVAIFLHGIGWVIQKTNPEGMLAPAAFRIAFLSFGGCLVLAGILYAFTVDDKSRRRRG